MKLKSNRRGLRDLLFTAAFIGICSTFLSGCKEKAPEPTAKAVTPAAPAAHYDTLTSRVKVGESFNSIAKNLGLPESESSLLLSGIKENFRFKLFAGQAYRIIFKSTDAGRRLDAFILEDRYSEHRHVLAMTEKDAAPAVPESPASSVPPSAASLPAMPSMPSMPAAMNYSMVDIPIRMDTVAVAGSLTTNLYEAFLSKGETPALIQLVTKIFAWDVDFFKDPRVGDAFSLLVEKRYGEDGSFRGYGQVLSAKYVNRGKEFYGILYNGSYYDEKGTSLEKMLLKVPLNFARVSSGFTAKRLHPILGINRPHWGVDYAAPMGTHIFAAGDGTIEYAKWVNGYGNTMKIRHNGVYNTYYAHLRGFAPGMRAGRRVHQSEVVAYLGMTGLATGPHLDYRVECYGKFINPASLKMEAKDGVAKSEWKPFCDRRDALLARMVSSEISHLASTQPPKTGLNTSSL
jgi:murein DD-endopeptidase MepM/ murein hydrolase activator NlpD